MMIGTNNDYLEIDKHICWTMIVLAYVILDSCMSYPYLTKIPTSWCPRYLGKLSLLSEIECKKHQETILGIFSPFSNYPATGPSAICRPIATKSLEASESGHLEFQPRCAKNPWISPWAMEVLDVSKH